MVSQPVSKLAIHRRIYSKCQYCGNGIRNHWQRLRRAVGIFSKHLWRGELDEKKKVVLRKSLLGALLRCSIHFLAVFVTITIAYLNLAGRFIGAELQGLTGGIYQAIDILCLQVVAKLQELLIVASLGTIIAKILRHQLLFGREGLPLGLLTTEKEFTKANYLLSPEFRFGLAGFVSYRKRLMLGLLILTSTLLSLFAGPSTALLLIPTLRDNWPAGGASFWLVGDDESLWPSNLIGSSVGESYCKNPSLQALSMEALGYSGCIWAGYAMLTAAFRQRHLNGKFDFVIDDGVLSREFRLREKGEVAETWVLGSNMAAGVLSKNVAEAWYQALQGISVSSMHHTIRYRIHNGTTGTFQSWAPAVRTRCNMIDLIYQNSSGLLQNFPDLQEYNVRLDLNNLIQTNSSLSSSISIQWITVPEAAPLSDHSSTNDMPSAFMSVIIPHNHSSNTGTMFTCSVDARWARAGYHGSGIADLNANYIQTSTTQNTRPFSANLPGYQYNFLPINDGSWRRVQIDVDWLNNLTPPLPSSAPGWNSLAALFSDMGIDNSTGLIVNWIDISSSIEAVIATVVADGMSRQGYAANGGSMMHFSDGLSHLPWNNSASSQRSILAGTYSFPVPSGAATKLQWSVTVSGYAYKADSVAYYLALTVLFVHAALALSFVVYKLWTHILYDVWESFIELFLLAATSGSSGPADVFKNTSSGIGRYRTMKTAVRVRALSALSAAPTSQNDIKILFGKEKPRVSYQELEIEKAYG